MAKDLVLEAQIERAKMLLANRDIVLVVGGCGCCKSPSVYLEIEGEPIIFDPLGMEHLERYRRAADDAVIDNSGF